MLGVVDPRTLYQQMDSELVALWLAHFSLKNGDNPAANQQSKSDHVIIDHQDIDQQVSACERLLL